MSGSEPRRPPTPEQRRPSRIFSVIMGLFGLLGGVGFIGKAFGTGPFGSNLAIGLVFGVLGALWLLTGLLLGRSR